MNYKIAMIDDCANDMNILEGYINNEDFFNDFAIYKFNNYEKLLEDHYDLYFIDIDMPMMNGLEVVKRLENNYQESVVIFYSNRNDLIFETLTTHSIFFIRKNKIECDFNNAVNKIKSILKTKNRNFEVTIDGVVTYVYLDKIIMLEKEKNYIRIYYSNNRTFIIRGSFKDIKKNLDNNCFVFINSGTIINCKHIKNVILPTIVLSNENKVSVSRSRVKEFNSLYMNFIMED